MSAKILNLPPRHEDKGWVCGCGGFNWILYANGECLCVKCSFVSTVITVRESNDHERPQSASNDLKKGWVDIITDNRDDRRNERAVYEGYPIRQARFDRLIADDEKLLSDLRAAHETNEEPVAWRLEAVMAEPVFYPGAEPPTGMLAKREGVWTPLYERPAQKTAAHRCRFCELPAGHEGPHARSISNVMNALKANAARQWRGVQGGQARQVGCVGHDPPGLAKE